VFWKAITNTTASRIAVDPRMIQGDVCIPVLMFSLNFRMG
jgi:hypothetical protein